MSEFATELRPEDARLLQIAARPAARLFPILDRGAAFVPLLACVIVLPAVYAVVVHQPTTADATRALEAITFIETWSFDSPEAQSAPLAMLVLASTIDLVGPHHLWVYSAIGLLAHIAFLFLTFRLATRVFGVRAAIWTVVLLAAHPVLLGEARSVLGGSLAAAAAIGGVLLIWLGIAKEDWPRRWRTACGGICIGLATLCGAKYALLLAITACWFCIDYFRKRKELREGIESAVLVLAGFAIGGGWWWMMTLSSSPLTATLGWTTSSGSSGTGDWLVQLMWLFQATLIFAAVGAVHSRNETEKQSTGRRFAVGWLLFALFGIVLPAAANQSDAAGVLSSAAAMLLVPAAMLSALAIEAISERKIPNAGAITIPLMIYGVWIMLVIASVLLGDNWPRGWVNWNVIVAPCVIVIACALLMSPHRAGNVLMRPRYALRVSLTCVFFTTLFLAPARFRSEADGSRTSFSRVRQSLRQLPSPEKVLLITDQPDVQLPKWLFRSLGRNVNVVAQRTADPLPADLHTQEQTLVAMWVPIAAASAPPTALGLRFEEVMPATSFDGRVLHVFHPRPADADSLGNAP